jgi:hypothetical protein
MCAKLTVLQILRGTSAKRFPHDELLCRFERERRGTARLAGAETGAATVL